MKNAAMDECVERVRAESDILSVVASYVPLKRKGNRYWGCCPFHQEKTPSFSVVPSEGFFYCFGCHAGGNVFKFISLIENVSYFDAIKMQAEKLNIPLPQRERSEKEEARDRKIADLHKVLTMARDFFQSCLTRTPYGEPGMSYFAGRGIGQETIEAFQLGFAPNSYEKLRDAFMKRGVSEELLKESGLVTARQEGTGVYDRFRNRVMIPIADERGRVVGFGGRVMDDSTPKYLNSPETMIFNKRRLLFGLDRAKQEIRRMKYAILVEGYMDAISLYNAGIQNVAASLGTAFTIEQCRLLLRFAPEIYFCYDSDEAGQKATMRALGIVRETGAHVKVLVVPDGKDPDEFVRKHGKDAFLKLTETALPLTEYQTRYILSHHDVRTMDGKAAALQAMLPVLYEAANVVEQNEYIGRLTRTLGIDEGIIRQELANYRGRPDESLQPRRAPVRQAVRQVDNAVRRAGRIVIRQIWNDPDSILYLKSAVPLEKIPFTVHGEILRYFDDKITRGEAFSDTAAMSELSGDAADELSRALVENLDGQDLMQLFEDCVRVLRKTVLQLRFEELRLKADALERANDSSFLEVLRESESIRKEMDGL